MKSGSRGMPIKNTKRDKTFQGRRERWEGIEGRQKSIRLRSRKKKWIDFLWHQREKFENGEEWERRRVLKTRDKVRWQGERREEKNSEDWGIGEIRRSLKTGEKETSLWRGETKFADCREEEKDKFAAKGERERRSEAVEADHQEKAGKVWRLGKEVEGGRGGKNYIQSEKHVL